ncbi:transcription factor IWS1 [Cryptococcus deuterogattii R265]|uniref:Transcription factor IWS1 n=1 Tax=Cryptococcus deuterogattii (strain R265) TaxID=294750 RepID=A0A095CE42_CRYD2|nr:transcription factor IWS1 [Cryptococcus deuterogattii R265]KIR36815.1 transcription factor IWS1 [Cryptococcus deuterogattii MMRL2647]KIR74619.1 transcription factor IWS1 [Cryptococcus deuterogattii CA1014]
MSSPALDTVPGQTEEQDLPNEVQAHEHSPVGPTPEVPVEPESDSQDDEEQPEAQVSEQEQGNAAEQERLQDQEDQEQGAELVLQRTTAEEQEETRDELYNEVFGNQGSDASDLSDDEDARMDEGDKYVPATLTSAAKIPKFKKSKRDDEDEDEDEDDEDGREERRRKKKKKAERRRQREEEEEEEEAPVLDEATQRRLALEERIDAIGKKPKAVRRKKKGDDDVDIVDSYHDDICARLRDRMIAAADKDEAANKIKMPGTAKLAMLDEVMAVLRNTTLWQSIVDNGVLEAVKRWLEPLPDKSLPSVGIQKAIFEVLPKMDLDTTTLKECRLGPIVLFYTKTKRVTPAINRQADALVQAWSRPIIKRPANYRSRYIESQNEVEQSQGGGSGTGGGYSQSQRGTGERRFKRFDVKKALEENAHRKGARLQIVQDVQYTVAPEPKTQHQAEEMQHVSRIQQDNKKFNRFARQVKTKKH